MPRRCAGAQQNSGGGLAAVATVGGGAAIPLINQQPSEALRVPVIAGPGPAFTAAAAGAACWRHEAPPPDAPTSIGVAAADAPHQPGAVGLGRQNRRAGGRESASDGSPSATFPGAGLVAGRRRGRGNRFLRGRGLRLPPGVRPSRGDGCAAGGGVPRPTSMTLSFAAPLPSGTADRHCLSGSTDIGRRRRRRVGGSN